MCRGNPIELCLSQCFNDIGVKARAPRVAHIFVREIRSLSAPGVLHQCVDERVAAQMARFRRREGARHLEPGFSLAPARSADALTGGTHQALQAEGALPSRQCVVAQMDDATRPNLAGKQTDDPGSDLIGHPAPQAMHTHDVDLRYLLGRGIDC
jgi:hypothetical protein